MTSVIISSPLSRKRRLHDIYSDNFACDDVRVEKDSFKPKKRRISSNFRTLAPGFRTQFNVYESGKAISETARLVETNKKRKTKQNNDRKSEEVVKPRFKSNSMTEYIPTAKFSKINHNGRKTRCKVCRQFLKVNIEGTDYVVESDDLIFLKNNNIDVDAFENLMSSFSLLEYTNNHTCLSNTKFCKIYQYWKKKSLKRSGLTRKWQKNDLLKHWK